MEPVARFLPNTEPAEVSADSAIGSLLTFRPGITPVAPSIAGEYLSGTVEENKKKLVEKVRAANKRAVQRAKQKIEQFRREEQERARKRGNVQ